MSRILVTGGCGFIGSHLGDRLAADGHEVLVLDDLSTGRRENLAPRARLLEAGLSDAGALTRALDGVDLCYHLAAVASVERSITAWRASTETNLLGSVAVFEHCATARIPVVYASSAAVYGPPARLPLDEAAPARPLSPYGVDKLAMEAHARVGGLCRGLRSFGLRLFNVFGSRQDPASPYSGVISIFLGQARAGAALTLHGDGSQTRDFVHVSDAVEALVRAAGKASTEAPVYNLCRGEATSIRTLARTIVALTGSDSPVAHLPPRAGDLAHSLGDPSPLERLLGWAPARTLEEGLREILDAGAGAKVVPETTARDV